MTARESALTLYKSVCYFAPQVQCPLNGSAATCDSASASASFTCGTLSAPTPRVKERVLQSGYRIEVRARPPDRPQSRFSAYSKAPLLIGGGPNPEPNPQAEPKH